MAQHFQYSQPGGLPSLNLDLPPASPDALSMPGLGRPAEAGMPPFGQYPSQPTHGSGNGDVMTAARTFPGGYSHQGFMQNQGLQPMMTQFMDDRGAPWNPLRMNADSVFGEPARRQPAGISSSQMFSNFGNARSAPPPSEADTVSQSIGGILSDSGYGSMARQSVGNPSVYGGEVDQNAETQSLIAQFQELAQETASPQESSRKHQGRGQKSSLGRASNQSLKCPDCGAVLRTNSELR
ncbi:uncharacterized protein B0T15DRAFT_127963 [Chaetomium strumarium]|uniref:Uncharacterized protein n=1 Tax=Chaetomium strumarium TaxID=1170767 RepID=A0AAJ0GZI2_9PEZI|nr:hypothetical protein B0T15DRAFT_127963 [Chaetomium strumarium]